MGSNPRSRNKSQNTNDAHVISGAREGGPVPGPDPGWTRSAHELALLVTAAAPAQTLSVSRVVTVVDVEPEGHLEGALEMMYGEQVNIE